MTKKQTRETEQQRGKAADALPVPISSNSPDRDGQSPLEPRPTVLPDTAKPLAEQEPAVLLAMCLFGEARGESDLVRRAVAQVILNRVKNPRPLFGARKGAEFEENLRCVIIQPQQFSSLNPYDPNYAGLMHPLEEERPEVWERCLRCAEKALADRDKNDTLTGNSDHYFDDSIQPPSWADPTKQTVKVGRLNFYRLYLPPLKRGSASEPVAAAPDPSSGSRLRAKVSVPASRGGDTLARGSHGPRPNMSLPAPKSSRGHNSGPGPYPRYEWSRRLSILTLLCLTLLLSARSHLQPAASQLLAVTQTEYQTTRNQVVEDGAQGLIAGEQWDQFPVQETRSLLRIFQQEPKAPAFFLMTQQQPLPPLSSSRMLLWR